MSKKDFGAQGVPKWAAWVVGCIFFSIIGAGVVYYRNEPEPIKSSWPTYSPEKQRRDSIKAGESARAAEADLRALAYWTAKQGVKEMLSEYDVDVEEENIVSQGDGVFDVTGWVSFRNQYNAKERHGWSAIAEVRGKECRLPYGVYINPKNNFAR